MAANPRIEFAQRLTDVCVAMLTKLCDVELYTYQSEIADRIFFSLIIGDAEEITIETARQAGKSEVLAGVAATALVLMPLLARVYPNDPVLSKFEGGISIGCFGPVEEQADTIFSRIKARLTAPHAQTILQDPEVDEEITVVGHEITTRRNSICRRQTCHASAHIESKTYHLAIIDEAQDADSVKVRQAIHPMLVATAGTIVKVGTPGKKRCDFLDAIKRNKRRPSTNGKKNYLGYDWRRAARENKLYAQAIKKERERGAEDTDEFLMSYCLRWMLERGMLTTDEQLQGLADEKMTVHPYYTDSPIVIGIDVARTHDSTVATALWVDWSHPDEFGLYNCRVLDWLEIHGEKWESQYAQIVEFVSHYSVAMIGVDSQGMGGVVAERLEVLLPRINVVAAPMDPATQHERWTHLIQLMQRGLIGWPAHPSTRRLSTYKRFIAQMREAEKDYKGKFLHIHAPNGDKNAHDDYVDSLAIAAWLTMPTEKDDTVEVLSHNPLLERNYLRRAPV